MKTRIGIEIEYKGKPNLWRMFIRRSTPTEEIEINDVTWNEIVGVMSDELKIARGKAWSQDDDCLQDDDWHWED